MRHGEDVVPIFIDRGAPLSTHLRTLSLAVLASDDGSLEHVLAAFDPDLAVVDLDDIDKRPHVGLSKWHSPAGEMLLHHTSRCPLWANSGHGSSALVSPKTATCSTNFIGVEGEQNEKSDFHCFYCGRSHHHRNPSIYYRRDQTYLVRRHILGGAKGAYCCEKN